MVPERGHSLDEVNLILLVSIFIPHQPYDRTDDDPIDRAASVKSTHSDSPYIVSHSIKVCSEFASGETCQPLTCIVVIELPARRGTTHVPGHVISDLYGARSAQSHSRNDTDQMLSPSQSMRLPSPAQRYDACTEDSSPSYLTSSPESPRHTPPVEDSHFKSIVEDLRNRIIDWKDHALSGLGPLQMHDMLSVRREALVREFFIYLFEEAIICVVEEKKRSRGRCLSSPAFNDASTFSPQFSNHSNKCVLRLKSRIIDNQAYHFEHKRGDGPHH